MPAVSNMKALLRKYALQRPDKSVPYGLGCAWIGRRGIRAEQVKEETALLETAYEQGFRYYDTSAAYGDSEIIVGEWLSHVPRSSIFLATKSRIPERISSKLAAKWLLLHLEASLERLQTDYIDLMQIHDVETLVQVLGSEGAIHALQEAKAKGLIRSIGLATKSHALLQEGALSGKLDAILTYADLTPIDPCASSLVGTASGAHICVINGSPLAFGLLTGSDLRERRVNKDDTEAVKRHHAALQFQELCGRYGISVVQAALHYPLLDSRIDLTLTGPSNSNELQLTLQALDQSMPSGFWDEWEAMHIKD